jgi:hypothetical protein
LGDSFGGTELQKYTLQHKHQHIKKRKENKIKFEKPNRNSMAALA